MNNTNRVNTLHAELLDKRNFIKKEVDRLKKEYEDIVAEYKKEQLKFVEDSLIKLETILKALYPNAKITRDEKEPKFLVSYLHHCIEDEDVSYILQDSSCCFPYEKYHTKNAIETEMNKLGSVNIYNETYAISSDDYDPEIVRKMREIDPYYSVERYKYDYCVVEMTVQLTAKHIQLISKSKPIPQLYIF